MTAWLLYDAELDSRYKRKASGTGTGFPAPGMSGRRNFCQAAGAEQLGTPPQNPHAHACTCVQTHKDLLFRLKPTRGNPEKPEGQADPVPMGGAHVARSSPAGHTQCSGGQPAWQSKRELHARQALTEPWARPPQLGQPATLGLSA